MTDEPQDQPTGEEAVDDPTQDPEIVVEPDEEIDLGEDDVDEVAEEPEDIVDDAEADETEFVAADEETDAPEDTEIVDEAEVDEAEDIEVVAGADGADDADDIDAEMADDVEFEDEPELDADAEDDSAPPAYAIDPDLDEDDVPDPDNAESDDETRPVSAVAAAVAGGAAAAGRPFANEPPIDPPTDTPATGEDEKPPRKLKRKILLGAIVVLGLLYVAGYFLTGSRMQANATVGGVDVGGMAPAAARESLDDELSPRADEPVRLTHGKEEFEVVPKDVGLSADFKASAAQAGGSRSWDPRDMVALFFGDHEYPLVVDADDSALESAVNAMAETVDVPVTEALITFPKAKPKPRSPEAGLVVRKEDTAQAIREAYLVEEDAIDVPVADVEPAVDQAGLDQAMTDIAKPAVADPVTIKVGKKKIDLPVTAYAPALTVEPVKGAMGPVIDPEKLAKPLTNATTGIGKKAVDARVDIKDGKPVVIPGKEGVGLQPEEMAEKLVPVLTKTGDERAVEVEAKVVEPTFTTKDAKKLGIKEKISEFTTKYPHAEYRNTNQGRAAEILDGTLLKPGDVFSFNNTVGERTAANGFTSGSVINNGRFQDELGGGVSQVVTTTYNAAFFAGLEDIEHHPHAFYIDRYPVGREATVYFGSLDLRFKNQLKNGVLIKAFVKRSAPGTSGEMTVQMWGTKEYDVKAGQSERRNHRSPGTKYDDSAGCQGQAPLPGFDIDIYRTMSKGGKVVKRETNTANYQAADRIICGKKPKDDD